MIAREPERVELVRGVTWTLRPRDGLLQCIVEAEVAQTMRRLREGADVLADFGLEGDVLEMAAPDIAVGFAMFVEAAAWAKVLLVSWEGVLGPDGQAAEMSTENIRGALRYGATADGPVLLGPFNRWLNAAPARRAAEGKG